MTDWALNALSAAVDVPPELLKLSRAERAALLALLRADLKAKLRLRNLMRARFRRGGSVRPDDHRAG